MAILVISANPNGNPETDAAMIKQLNWESDPPAGCLLRAAGPVQDGWRIVSIWESQETFETFRRDRLEPALKQTGRPVPEFQFSPLASVNIPHRH